MNCLELLEGLQVVIATICYTRFHSFKIDR